ncbi:MAG: hypothetical protein IJX98_06865 [Clostridia bacterium]|nr:hypothetical protein [Clostridia bacterium]
MIKAGFTTEMKNILKKLKGAEFICYSASKFHAGETVHDGVIYIHANNVSIKVSNEEMQIPWFNHKELNTIEDIFVFHCEETFEKARKNVVFVQEKIEEMELIADCVKIPKEEYEITLDMALIIITKAHRYVLSRGWYFGESLSIDVDKNYDEIYPIKQVVEEWNNFGEWEVKVNRVIEKL